LTTTSGGASVPFETNDVLSMFHHLDQHSPHYPERLRHLPAYQPPAMITALGNLDILKQDNLLALYCSRKCPGALILKLYDYARALRQQGTTVIGGFHTPMEQECLTILLRGAGNLVICPARGLEQMRVPSLWQELLDANRLLLLSPFGEKQRRVTAALANARNEFVAALAAQVVIVYAEAGGNTEQLAARVAQWRTPVFTFDSAANANLLRLGARPLVGTSDVAQV